MTHLLSSADISIFSPKIGYRKILLYQEIPIWIAFNFFRVFKDFFNKHHYNFDDVSKNSYFRPS